MILLFVYGTLREGQPLHHLTNRAMPPSGPNRIGGVKATLPGYSLHDGPGFPYAVEGKHGWPPVGELYVVDTDSDAFQSINRIECGAGYTPKAVQVYLPDDDEPLQALAYIVTAADAPRLRVDSAIDGGDWCEHRTARLMSAEREVEHFEVPR